MALRFSPRSTPLAAVLAALILAVPAAPQAQTNLGEQRAGTASGTFLKIPFSAREAALARAYGALAVGPEAASVNPAGLSFTGEPAVSIGYIQWPAEITITSIAHARYLQDLGTHLGLFAAGLRTTMEETDEFHPLGTGREFSFSDLVAGLYLSRHFTDRLTIGVGVKYFQENLATELGGPRIQTVLFDAGNVYRLGFRQARLAIAITNFGGDLRPDGGYDSRLLDGEVRYSAFAAPTVFRLSFALDSWRRGDQTLWTMGEIQNLADNEETFIGALEWTYSDLVALRAGYNFNGDAFKLGLGAGWTTHFSGTTLGVDYAFSDAEYLGDVHHWSLNLTF
ncbi:MAG: PorV/PorQ family protein [Candidatus Eisenbacteria bacterium]|nr:PorV/PorQ family protein [Candidatus Eisenbacteria bacterium]